MSTNIVTFLKDNPNSNKEAISENTGHKGLLLFNLLRKLQTEGVITSTGEGKDVVFSLAEAADEEQEEVSTDEVKEQPEETVDVEEQSEVAANRKAGKDNSKFTFLGDLYGKGPLVRAVVAKYVENNPGVTYKELKEIFPDELLKRFGIFQEISILDVPKMRVRYFSKGEQQIQVKDKCIVVCNQFTSENIQPFLTVARQLGYKIK